MQKQDIPLQKLDSETVLFNPFIYRISDLYRERTVEVVSRPHRLNFSALIYITEGKGVHYVDHKMYQIKAGTLLTLGKNQIHAFTKNRLVDGYVLPFNCTLFADSEQESYAELMLSALKENNVVRDVGENIDTLFRLLVDEFQSESEFRNEVIRNLLRTIILKSVVPYYKQGIDNTSSLRRNDFYRMKTYIDDHYSQRPTASDIATALGKSVKQLNRLSKENTGCSVKELVDERVLTEAKRLLAFSQFSIVDVANQLGFNEATNLTKFFKRHTDINPKDFRQLCKMGLNQH